MRGNCVLLAVLAALVFATGAPAMQRSGDDEWSITPPGLRERPRLETEDLGAAPVGARAAAASSFLARHGGSWQVHWNERTGTAHQLFGSGADLVAPTARALPMTADRAEGLARGLLAAHPELFGSADADLVRRQSRQIRGRWSVHFEQRHQGIPVIGARAYAVFTDSGRLLAAGSDLHSELPLSTTPALSGAQAAAIAEEALGYDAARDERVSAPELMLLPLEDEVRLVWAVRLRMQQPFGLWVHLIDATNGEILLRQNGILRFDVSGNVSGEVTDIAVACGDPLEDRPSANQNVDFPQGGTVTTDASGAFTISGLPENPQYTTELSGPFLHVNVHPSTGSNATLEGIADPGVPLELDWTPANSRDDERAVWYHTNLAHDEILALDPTMDFPMSAVVGNPAGVATCPWWDPAGIINFCEVGTVFYPPWLVPTSVNNTGEIADLILHEYGHAVTHVVYGSVLPPPWTPPTDLHEGNADVFAALMTGQPKIGRSFFMGHCDWAMRSVDNDLDIRFDWDPTPTTGHFNGQFIAGVVWDTWQELKASLGEPAARDLTLRLWHDGRVLMQPASQAEQVRSLFVADDDDGNLDNGTPHFAELCAAARAHGFEGAGCPPADPSFAQSGVELSAWIAPDDLATLSGSARGVAGHVSPSGREYAVLATTDGVAVVEVTDPGAPAIVDEIASEASDGIPGTVNNPEHREVVVHGGFAYVVSSAGSAGLVVVDLRQVDAGIVSLHASLTDLGFLRALGTVVDPASSLLFLGGANNASDGLQIVDLADPSNPVFGAQWTGAALAGLAAHTVTSGPFIGRQLVFAASGAEGVRVLDVSDPANPVSLATTLYPVDHPEMRHATHLALDPTGRFLYVGDGMDELFKAVNDHTAAAARTFVFDVQSPANPRLVATYDASLPMREQALEVSGPNLIQANFRGGVRIVDIRDPRNAVERGFFETYPNFPAPHPPDDLIPVTGALGVAARLPSGTLLAADNLRGFFILDPGASVFAIGGVEPAVGTPGSTFTLHGAGFEAGAMVEVGGLVVTDAVVVDSHTITGTVPAGVSGVVDVTVRNPGPGGSETTLAGAFALPAPCDLDSDGSVDGVDVLLATRILQGDLNPTGPQEANGDVAPLGTPDGVFDAADLAVLVRGARGEAGVCAP